MTKVELQFMLAFCPFFSDRLPHLAKTFYHINPLHRDHRLDAEIEVNVALRLYEPMMLMVSVL